MCNNLNPLQHLSFASLQEKCHQYWPENGCWIYGNMRVAMEDFTVLVDYTIRRFCIQYVRICIILCLCKLLPPTNVLLDTM